MRQLLSESPYSVFHCQTPFPYLLPSSLSRHSSQERKRRKCISGFPKEWGQLSWIDLPVVSMSWVGFGDGGVYGIGKSFLHESSLSWRTHRTLKIKSQKKKKKRRRDGRTPAPTKVITHQLVPAPNGHSRHQVSLSFQKEHHHCLVESLHLLVQTLKKETFVCIIYLS